MLLGGARAGRDGGRPRSRRPGGPLHGAGLGHASWSWTLDDASGRSGPLHRLRRHAVRCGGPHRREAAAELRIRPAPDRAAGTPRRPCRSRSACSPASPTPPETGRLDARGLRIRLYADSCRRAGAERTPDDSNSRRSAEDDFSVKFAAAGDALAAADGFFPLGQCSWSGGGPRWTRGGGLPVPDRTGDAMSGGKVVRDRRRAGLLGRLARGAGPPGAGRADRLPDDGLPRRSHDVHHAEAEVARPARRLRARLRAADGADPPGHRGAAASGHLQRRRRQPARLRRGGARVARGSSGSAGKLQGRPRHRRRHPAADSTSSSRARPRAARHGDRPPARRHPRPGPVGQRLPRHGADRRGARAAARTWSSPGGSPIPGSRWGRCSTSSAGAATTGTRSPRAPSPGTSSSAARRPRAATCSRTGAR